jgi:hypothetical protein
MDLFVKQPDGTAAVFEMKKVSRPSYQHLEPDEDAPPVPPTSKRRFVRKVTK